MIRHRQARTARIKVLKQAFPAFAILLLVACAVQVTLRGLRAPTPVTTSAEGSRMLAPRFAGKSRDGRHYVVTGREGMADPKDSTLILIDKPVLKLTTRQNKTSTMTAQTGVYKEAANQLLLKGDVRVDNGAGSRFASQQAVVDTHTGAVSGQQGLRAESPSAQVQARDYTVMDEGDRLILKGGVSGRLAPQN